MSDNLVPGHAQTVLAPFANPENAQVLLQLGVALAQPNEGRVIALFISMGATEAASKLVEKITPFVNQLKERGHPVELKVHVSTSVARGILDVAREELADMLVMGAWQVDRPQEGLGGFVQRMVGSLAGWNKAQLQQSSGLGSIVESVIGIAPCDVLIYRAAPQAEFERIVVPVDGSLHSAEACRIGILVGESYQIPVEAIHAQESFHPQWEGRGRIEQSLAGLPREEMVKRTVVSAHDAVNGILSTVNKDDLIIIGISERSALNRWLFGDFTGRMLRNARGPVILLRRSLAQNGKQGLFSRLISRLTLTLTTAEQDEILWQAEEMASPTLDYLVLVAISVILASLGLLMNSPAVIIGAMLVAPLMQPLIGLAVGGATGRIDVVRRALGTLTQGIAIAMLASTLIGFIAAPYSATAEMLARGSSGLLDIGVALASGFVGAYATARKDIPGALAGVAIAAALMPPLCTVGLSLGAGNLSLSARAGLLFLLNIAGISIAAWIVFLWLGLRPKTHRDAASGRI